MKPKIDQFVIGTIIPLILLSIQFISVTGQDLRKIENNTFQKGEKLFFRVCYDSFLPGFITVGDASLEIRENNIEVAGRNAMHIVGEGKSRRFFNWFYRVRNRYETYIDTDAIVPWYFKLDIHEGGYQRAEDINFNQFENTAYARGKKLNTPEYVQDAISTFYYARTLDFSNIKPGDAFKINYLFKDSIYVTKIIFEGRETISTNLGTFNTLRFKPMMLQGSIFKQPYPATLWITDDENKIPVLAESKVIIGSIRLELTDYHGLKNPITAKTN